MAKLFIVTVITLCRNNPEDLRETLSSLPSAAIGLSLPWQLLVLDGSDDLDCTEVANDVAYKLKLPLVYVRQEPQGIYAAMNQATRLAEGMLLTFMHAGDCYLPRGLSALVGHWLELVENQKEQIAPLPAAVFGQAYVSSSGGIYTWLTPDSAMRNLRRWLKGMVPCHQAFLFERGFAIAHPYDCGSIVADRAVMREALLRSGPEAYLRQPVCIYDLTGVSSALPCGPGLIQFLIDPHRSLPERAAEIVKFLLRPMFSRGYPRLMRWRSRVWGFCCR